MTKTVKSIVTALAIAFITGGLELRSHVVGLEVQVSGVAARVDRIERLLDQREYAHNDP